MQKKLKSRLLLNWIYKGLENNQEPSRDELRKCVDGSEATIEAHFTGFRGGCCQIHYVVRAAAPQHSASLGFRRIRASNLELQHFGAPLNFLLDSILCPD